MVNKKDCYVPYNCIVCKREIGTVFYSVKKGRTGLRPIVFGGSIVIYDGEVTCHRCGAKREFCCQYYPVEELVKNYSTLLSIALQRKVTMDNK